MVVVNCCKDMSYAIYLCTCSIENGIIDTDLYKKPTDRNQYLLPESCHPQGTTKSIPFSLGLRINRICRKTENRDKRLQELKVLLLERGYQEHGVDLAFAKARSVPRNRALLKRKNTDLKRPVFALKYDPRLPPIQSIQAKHWRAMKSQDQHLASDFPTPPLTAFRRQANLRNL